MCCYHAVGVTSKKHSKGRKLLAAGDTIDTENDAPQVAPSKPPDLQVEILVKFQLNFPPSINAESCVSFQQDKLKLLEFLAVLFLLNIVVNFSKQNRREVKR